MALICMSAFDTEENGRSEYTKKTFKSLISTVDLENHRLVVIDNNSCRETADFLHECMSFGYITLITNKANLGTAEAINQGIKLRKPGEYVIKIDNDVVIHQSGWVDEMEEAIKRDPSIGILGLKRKDLAQSPNNTNLTFKSELIMLPHEPGERWITVERADDIMGTCTMLNPKLLDAVGGLWQPGLYGFDDTLMSLRSRLAGFKNCFLTHIEIDHIDRGDNPYLEVKHKQAGDDWEAYKQAHIEFSNGTRDIYYL